MPDEEDARRFDAVLLAGLLLVVAVAAAFRLPHLSGNLPRIVGPDEPTIMDRALRVLHGHVALSHYDWPPASMELLGGVMRAARAVSGSLLQPHGGVYAFGRVVFVAISLAAVLLTGLVAAELADDWRDRRLVAWAAAVLVALSFVSVRTSRLVHPDHLQLAFMLGALLATFAYDRSRRWPWLAGAGALAGLAGATKYVGVLIVVAAIVSILWPEPRRPRLRRAHHLGLLLASMAVGFVAGAPAVFAQPGQMWHDLGKQFGHQATGHLGYDSRANGWWFHLHQSLPGNWGYGVTALAVVGTVWVLVRGTRPQRLTAAAVIPLFALVGTSRVRFPHYVLVVVPLLACLGMVALVRLARRAGVAGGVVLAVAVGITLVPAVLDDARLVRAAGAIDTRLVAAAAVRRLDGPIRAEQYALPDGTDDFGTEPPIVECECYVAISSYKEERYRREPRRYRRQVAVYDALRAKGRVVAVIGPRRHLAYDWDLLPQWGLRRIPLTGAIGPVGPTITILDLRAH